MTHWTGPEVAQMDALIRANGKVAQADMALFPGRTWHGVRRQAQKRRKALRIILVTKGSQEPAIEVDPHVAERWARSADRLHRATVRMCIRRGITLPGMSAERTIAIAADLRIAA